MPFFFAARAAVGWLNVSNDLQLGWHKFRNFPHRFLPNADHFGAAVRANQIPALQGQDSVLKRDILAADKLPTFFRRLNVVPALVFLNGLRNLRFVFLLGLIEYSELFFVWHRRLFAFAAVHLLAQPLHHLL